MTSDHFSELIGELSSFPEVDAIVLGGSRASGAHDDQSDYDVYVYLNQPLALDQRQQLATHHCHSMELNNTYWETEDDGILKNGLHLDLIYRRMTDLDAALSHTLVDCHPGNSYTTCLWHNLLQSTILFDRKGSYFKLQQRFSIPYPEKLRERIIERSRNLLQGRLPSFYEQIKKAVERQDLVSINHRVAEFLASYFDLVLAYNRKPHPGEKRLIAFVLRECPAYPANFQSDLEAVIRGVGQADQRLIEAIDRLLLHLDAFIA
jgi:hypothetical protein